MSIDATTSSAVVRRRWLVTGQVQGVGYRPHVYRLARERGLTGFVRNRPDGVTIECQGSPEQLQGFAGALASQQPPLAAVQGMYCEAIDAVAGEPEFRIEESLGLDKGKDVGDITVDTAACPACVREMLSNWDRRFGYGLTNCTDCGPRYTIVRKAPYDRANTTMAGFRMCAKCRKEYEDPADRRFHAQPNACRECGPTVSLVDARGNAVAGDPILAAVWMLAQGQILAIKGLGGFHLAVRADDENAVERMRKLKRRDRKPFAVMCASLEEAQRIVKLSGRAKELLRSPTSPVVLCEKRLNADVAQGVAPGNHRLGVMLPYTPIHHLLFDRGSAWWSVLVMTSGNVTDEPLAIDNAEALERLGPLCDAFLWHDRPIQRGVDDSVLLDLGEDDLLPIRRSRGYAPASILLAGAEGQEGLCLGGELKNTVAVVRRGQAVLSQHLGDLTHVTAFDNFRRAIDDMQQLFAVTPQWIAHDEHPMYLSTQEARKLGAERGIPTIAVQHHHAHAAAVLAEHGVTGPALAVVCDGTGYGPDGTVWGGELLAADLTGYRRLMRLRPLLLAGGDAAAKDTRRCGMALLNQAYGARMANHAAAVRMMPNDEERDVVARMVRDAINCTASSGAGRYFDGVAALLGLCEQNHFEAEAALQLEAAASRADAVHPTEVQWYEILPGSPREIDLSPLVRELMYRLDRKWPAAELAALFHETFARAWFTAVLRAAEETNLRTVALSGGVFCNERVTRRLRDLLTMRGFRVLRHRLVPPNDGGLALGQAAVAAAQVRAGMARKAGG